MAPDARYTIDSISDGVARLEAPDGTLVTVPVDRLPADAREGDVLAATRQYGAGQHAGDRSDTGQDPADRENAGAAEGPAAAAANPARSGDGRSVTFRRDPDATAARRESVRDKLDRLRRRGQT